MKDSLARLVGTVFVIILSVGITLTYERYKGTGLSRVPEKHLPREVPPSKESLGKEDRNSAAAPPLPDPPAPATGPAESPTAPASGGSDHLEGLTIYPMVTKGMRTPFDLWHYYGRGVSSFTSPDLPMRFEQWLDFHKRQTGTDEGRHRLHERSLPFHG